MLSEYRDLQSDRVLLAAEEGPPRMEEEGDDEKKFALSLWEMVLLFAFALGNGSLIGSYFLITLPMEAKRIDVEKAAMYLGVFVCIAGLTQLICPIVGLYSDRCNSKYGRRRPFLFVGGVVGVFGLYMQLLARSIEAWWLYAAAFTISMIALNTIYSSMNGLIPDHVPEFQTGKANGVIAMLSVIGAVGSFAVFHYAVSDLNGFYKFYMLTVASTVAATVATAGRLEAREHFEKAKGENVTLNDIKTAFYISPREPLHRDFFLILVSRTLYYMGISSQTFLMYYVRDQLNMEESEAEQFTAVLAVIGQCCGVLTALPIGMISDSCGGKRKIFIYAACLIMAVSNLSFVLAGSRSEVIFVTCLIGAANGMYLTMDGSMAIDALPSKSEAARWLGLWGVGAFVGTALGPVIGGPLLLWNADSNGGYTIFGYTMLLVASALYLSLSGFVLRSTRVQ